MTTFRFFVTCFLLMISINMLSCESTRRSQTLRREYKEIYINQFKLTYFRKLLIKSYNNSAAVKEIIGNDHSGFTEPILTMDDYNLIDSFTTIDHKHLIADSLNGYKRAEGAQGKRSLGYIMDKLNSKWLDRLAKQRLKINGNPDSWIY